jgi:hypothetical protein
MNGYSDPVLAIWSVVWLPTISSWAATHISSWICNNTYLFFFFVVYFTMLSESETIQRR